MPEPTADGRAVDDEQPVTASLNPSGWSRFTESAAEGTWSLQWVQLTL